MEVDKKGGGYWTKPPYQPKNPTATAKNNDPTTWGTYEQALAAFEAGKCDGIGFNLLGSNIPAFDVDKCRDQATGDDRAGSHGDRRSRDLLHGDHAVGHRLARHRLRQRRQECIASRRSPAALWRSKAIAAPSATSPSPATRCRQTWPHMADIDGVIDAVVAELDGVRNARQDKASQDNAQQDLDDEFAASADAEPASADDWDQQAPIRGRIPAGRSDRTDREGRSATGRSERRVSSRRVLACRLWLVGGAH